MKHNKDGLVFNAVATLSIYYQIVFVAEFPICYLPNNHMEITTENDSGVCKIVKKPEAATYVCLFTIGSTFLSRHVPDFLANCFPT